MDITSLGRGRYLVTDGTRTRLAFAARDGAGTWVFLDGRVHVMGTAAAGRERAPAREEEDALAAPMPATVVKIAVAAGDRVSRGDLLITLEAMKMELPITAPRDGQVRAIACRAGDLVQPGVPLLEIE